MTGVWDWRTRLCTPRRPCLARAWAAPRAAHETVPLFANAQPKEAWSSLLDVLRERLRPFAPANPATAQIAQPTFAPKRALRAPLPPLHPAQNLAISGLRGRLFRATLSSRGVKPLDVRKMIRR